MRARCRQRSATSRCRRRSTGSRPHPASAWQAASLTATGPRMKKPSSRSPRRLSRAFNAGDAKAVAALYTDDAELIDEYGDRIQGRPTIQEFYSALFNERKEPRSRSPWPRSAFLAPTSPRRKARPASNRPAASRRLTATTRSFM